MDNKILENVVIIAVNNGVVEIIKQPENIKVFILDYDNFDNADICPLCDTDLRDGYCKFCDKFYHSDDDPINIVTEYLSRNK